MHSSLVWIFPAFHQGMPQGGDSIFTNTEWDAPQFKSFQQTLGEALVHADYARRAPNEQLAREAWIRAFNGQSPS